MKDFFSLMAGNNYTEAIQLVNILKIEIELVASVRKLV